MSYKECTKDLIKYLAVILFQWSYFIVELTALIRLFVEYLALKLYEQVKDPSTKKR